MPPPWLFLTVLGSIPAILLFGRDWLDLRGMNLVSGHVWGRDFVNVWTGGHLVLEGRSDMIYGLRDYVAYQRELVGPIGRITIPIRRPPCFLLRLSDCCLISPLWSCGSWAHWLSFSGPLVLTSATFRASRSCCGGHARCVDQRLGGTLRVPDRSLVARLFRAHRAAAGTCRGAFAALLTIKPHLGLLLPPLLLARRKWRTIAVAAVGGRRNVPG